MATNATLRKPNKGEVVLHHRGKNLFKIVTQKFLDGYPAATTVTDPEPNNYDGYFRTDYETALKILGKPADPPEVAATFLAEQEAKQIIFKAEQVAEKITAAAKAKATAAEKARKDEAAAEKAIASAKK